MVVGERSARSSDLAHDASQGVEEGDIVSKSVGGSLGAHHPAGSLLPEEVVDRNRGPHHLVILKSLREPHRRLDKGFFSARHRRLGLWQIHKPDEGDNHVVAQRQ